MKTVQYTEQEHWDAAATLQRAYDHLVETAEVWTDDLQSAALLLEKHMRVVRKVAFQMSERRQGR